MKEEITVPWVDEMLAVFGWHEVRDKKKLSAWLRSDGKTLGDPTKLPWCGDAMDTALALALPKEPRPGDLGKNPYWALNWMYLGVKTEPVYGAIAAFKRTGGGHVGILVAEDETHFQVLGGNQGDAVGLTWIAKDKCKAIRWPSTYQNPKLSLPYAKRNGGTSSLA